MGAEERGFCFYVVTYITLLRHHIHHITISLHSWHGSYVFLCSHTPVKLYFSIRGSWRPRTYCCYGEKYTADWTWVEPAIPLLDSSGWQAYWGACRSDKGPKGALSFLNGELFVLACSPSLLLGVGTCSSQSSWFPLVKDPTAAHHQPACHVAYISNQCGEHGRAFTTK